MFSARTTILLLALIPISLAAAAAPVKTTDNDWPGWMGADRTGVSHEKGLLQEWPKGGPKLLWKVNELGEGYSTPSVAGGKIFLISNRGLDDEYALALNLTDGSKIWERRLGVVGNPKQRPSYPGSRSTPTVDGDSVYVLGSDGDLACLDAAKGDVRWKKSLQQDFDGKPGTWAYAESPLIDGDVLVCTPGGSKATLVALNKKSGEVIWQASVPVAGGGRLPGNAAAYASPIVATVGGIKQYIQFLTGGLVGVAAKDGKVLWQYSGVTGTTNCTTPLFHDDCVLVSAAGGGRGGGAKSGTALVKLTAEDGKINVKEIYHITPLANHHGGVVRVGDAVYGTNNNELVCIDFKTGETKWQNRCVGKGSITAADNRLYVRGEKEGTVALVDAAPGAYKEIARFEQPQRSEKNAWPHPVVADGRLFLRDQGMLLCYDVKRK
jgi:outer membrane protein assembly factor BamB